MILLFSLLASYFLAGLPTVKASSITVTVNLSESLGNNVLEFGGMLDHDLDEWRDSSTLRGYTQDAKIELIRFFEHRLDSKACSYWNETDQTGVFDWTEVDLLINRMFDIGATPLLVLGFYSGYSGYMSSCPNGMNTNYAGTNLPAPAQFASYCADWVQHFKDEAMPVNVYEIVNEPHQYYGSWGTNSSRVTYFGQLFNATAIAMRAVTPSINIGNDNSMVQWGGLNDFFATLEPLDFLSWHSYLTGDKSDSDAYLIDKAKNDEGGTMGANDFIQPARQDYYDARGVWLPVVQSEANLNYHWQSGADPRMQQIFGGVYIGLWLRHMISTQLVQYNVYYTLASQTSNFGMMNKYTFFRYYPYYVHYMIGGVGNLSDNDPMFNVTSNDGDISPMGWTNGNRTNVFLVHSGTGVDTVTINGLSGTYNYWLIDGSTTNLQTGVWNTSETKDFIGYSVMLLQQIGDVAPVYNDPQVSTDVAGAFATFSCHWTDDVMLSYGLLNHNSSGSYVNRTALALAGTNDVFIDSFTLNSTGGVVIGFRFYANDSANQWGLTPMQYLTTTLQPSVNVTTRLIVAPHVTFLPNPSIIPPAIGGGRVGLDTQYYFEKYLIFDYFTFEDGALWTTQNNITYMMNVTDTANVLMTIYNWFDAYGTVFKVSAPCTVQMNVSEKGAPTLVAGGSWTYNSTSKILGVSITGARKVNVHWSSGGYSVISKPVIFYHSGDGYKTVYGFGITNASWFNAWVYLYCLNGQADIESAILEFENGVQFGYDPSQPLSHEKLYKAYDPLQIADLNDRVNYISYDGVTKTLSLRWQIYFSEYAPVRTLQNSSILAISTGYGYLTNVDYATYFVYPRPIGEISIIDQYFMLALGIGGLVMSIGSPAMAILFFRKEGINSLDDPERIGKFIVLTLIGLGLIIIWLWG